MNEDSYLNMYFIASLLLVTYILGLPETHGKYNIVGVFLISVLKGLKIIVKIFIGLILLLIESILDLIIAVLDFIFGG